MTICQDFIRRPSPDWQWMARQQDKDEQDWGLWLRRARKAREWTQERMATEGDIKRTTYTNYELGTSPVPKELIAKYFSKGIVPPAQSPMVVREVSQPLYPVPALSVPIPKGAPVPCSDWSDPLEAEYENFVEVPAELAGKGRFACEIMGDSMYDLLLPGDLAVFQSHNNPKLGTVIIAVNEQNQATCKQLLYNGAEFILHSVNKKYEDVTSERWEAAGFLVGIVRKDGSRSTTIYDPEGIRP